MNTTKKKTSARVIRLKYGSGTCHENHADTVGHANNINTKVNIIAINMTIADPSKKQSFFSSHSLLDSSSPNIESIIFDSSSLRSVLSPG